MEFDIFGNPLPNQQLVNSQAPKFNIENVQSNLFGKTNMDGSYTGPDSGTGKVYNVNKEGKNVTGAGWSTAAQGVQAAAGLAQAYTGLKSLGLAKKQFSFQKDAANRDVANQAKLINESRANSGNVGLALAGNTMSDVQKTAARNKIISNNVDGSAIG